MPPGFWCADTLMQSGDAHYHYFNFQRGQRDRHLHTQIFSLQPLRTPSFFFTPMFNIKDEDSKRWGSNVFRLKSCIYHVHFHFTQLHTYYEQNSQGLRRLFYSASDTHKDCLTHGYSGRHTHREREGSRSNIQTQRDRETSTHTGRDMYLSDLHTQSLGERILQKVRQTTEM